MMSPPAEKLKAVCKIAGVEPTTRELNGEDPTAFVLSANIHRRHMTKGQRAMAVAKIYPGGSGKGANPTNLGLSHELIRQARLVLQYAPDLADKILVGTAKLDDAYKTARERPDSSQPPTARSRLRWHSGVTRAEIAT